MSDIPRIREMGYRRQFQDSFPKMYPEFEAETSCKKDRDLQLLTKTITFVVTEKCPLRCSYCYECNKDHSKVMSFETARKAVDLILDDNKLNGYMSSKASPAVIIEFIGGEPLEAVDIMDFICDYFRYRAFTLNHPWYKYHMFNITTNGVLYENPGFEKFLRKNRHRLSMTITIDGDRELHDACRVFPDGRGSYDIAVNALNWCRQYIDIPATKVTFAPENIQYIPRAVPHLFDLGFTEINANPVYEDVWKDEDAPVFYEILKELADFMIENKLYENAFCSVFDKSIGKPLSSEDNRNWCGGNGQMLAIGTDGRLFPCIRFMRYSLQSRELPEFEIGDVDKGLGTEDKNKYLKCLSCITRKSQSTDECWNCPVASGCSWCTGYNYDKFKDPDKRATFICKVHKARVLANYYYWNRLYEKLGITDEFGLNLLKDDVDFLTGGKGV